MKSIRNHGYNPELPQDQQWVAFPVALERGILPDETNVNPLDSYMPAIMSGLMPNFAGQIAHPSLRMAVDLIAVEKVDQSELILAPSDKLGVDKVTRVINDLGFIILSDELGRVKPLGVVDETSKLHWRRIPSRNRKASRIIDFKNGLSLELFDRDTPFYDFGEIRDNGSIVAKIPKRYF